jgi:cbb3-type cytochrome oxidase subunit 3
MLLNRLLLICSLIVLANSCKNSDQLDGSFQLSVTTDTASASIGDLITYKIITYNIGNKYFEIANRQFSEPLELRNSKLLYDKVNKVTGAEFIFSVWDTGMVTIPPITINLFNSDSVFDFAMATDSISIEVISIVDVTGDQNMKPIKGPIPIENVLQIRIFLLMILLSIILYGLYFIYGKRNKNIYDEVKVETNIDPADKIALNKLELLSKDSYDTKIKTKEFYIFLSHILREYVENSVYIKSLEMTTEEISRNRDSFPFNKEEINRWLDILNRADLSKYAKSNPEKNICDDDLNAGKEFVINTASSWKVLND